MRAAARPNPIKSASRDVRNERSVATILRTTCDHHLGWLGRLVLAPRNIGYHIVHHIHPQVAQEHLPALRAWYRARYPAQYPRG